MRSKRSADRFPVAWCAVFTAALTVLFPGCDCDDKDGGGGGAPPVEPKAMIEVSPDSVDFGGLALGGTAPATQKVTVSNVGTGMLTILAIEFSTDTHEDFQRAFDPADLELDAGESMVVELSFLPEAVGARGGTLNIESDDPERPLVSVAIAGQGILDPEWEIPLGECRDVLLPAESRTAGQYWISVPSSALVPAHCQYLVFEVRDPDPQDAEIDLFVSRDRLVEFDPDTGDPLSDWAGAGSVLIAAAELETGVYFVVAENLGDAEVSFQLCADFVDSGVPFRRGYIDGDDAITTDDVIYLLMFIFETGPVPGCRAAADTNADWRLNVSDAVLLLRYIFGDEPALPEPFTECGCDVSPHSLGCESFPLCAE